MLVLEARAGKRDLARSLCWRAIELEDELGDDNAGGVVGEEG